MPIESVLFPFADSESWVKGKALGRPEMETKVEDMLASQAEVVGRPDRRYCSMLERVLIFRLLDDLSIHYSRYWMYLRRVDDCSSCSIYCRILAGRSAKISKKCAPNPGPAPRIYGSFQ
jgi:hypothetical protein